MYIKKTLSVNPLTYFMLIFIFCIVFTNPIQAKSTWSLAAEEKRIEGTILAISNKEVTLRTSRGVMSFTFDTNLLAACTGARTGFIAAPVDFPLFFNVEIFLTPDGKVRAMRNIIENIDVTKGLPLDKWGHDLYLSPDDNHYMLFNYGDGLLLCDITNKENQLHLSDYPIAAWSNDGKKLAYIDNYNNILLYDINTHEKRIISYTKPTPNTISYINHLKWSPDDKNILCTFVQDHPNQGSELFYVKVFSKEGTIKFMSVVPYLASIFWYSNSQIVFCQYDNLNCDKGTIELWNLTNNDTRTLLSIDKNLCRNLALNTDKKTLAYTIKKGIGEYLNLLDITNNTTKTLKFLPFPLYNLQWSKNNELYFGNELNYVIYKLDKGNNLEQISQGYLPRYGVQNILLYFMSEPIEEPQQVYMK